jgi:hypothetical protein
MRRLATSRRLQSAEARYGQGFCWLTADMLRPYAGKLDAILRHVASWGDRFPMTVNTAKDARSQITDAALISERSIPFDAGLGHRPELPPDDERLPRDLRTAAK